MVAISAAGDPRDMHYVDFELSVGSASEGRYPIQLLNSPAGEIEGTMEFPFDAEGLETRLKDLRSRLAQPGGERYIQRFGRTIFEALLPGELRDLYYDSLRRVEQEGKGLRLKLRLLPPEMALIPWEFAYDPKRRRFVSLSRHTPLVRYIGLPKPIKPVAVELPLRVLGMVVSPGGLDPLEVDVEIRRVETAVRGLAENGALTVDWVRGATHRDLLSAIRGGPYHIFHFIGHGAYDLSAREGVVALEDESGETKLLSATSLGRLLRDHRSLRLVLLNSCEGATGSDLDIFSSVASVLIREGIPAVVAMQYRISDGAAIEFGQAFYAALADGMPVDAAVAEARKSMSAAEQGSSEWGVPVLYMRSRDGLLFRPQEKPPEPGGPTQSQKLAEKGRVLARNRDLAGALRCYVEATKLDATPDHLLRLGNLYAWKGDYDQALTELNRALEQTPESPQLYAARGTVYHWKARAISRGGDIENAQELLVLAISDFSRAMNLAPRESVFPYRRAIAFAYHGNFQRALIDLNHALQLKEDGEYYYRRGLVHYARGASKGARKDFRRAAGMGHAKARSRIGA